MTDWRQEVYDWRMAEMRARERPETDHMALLRTAECAKRNRARLATYKAKRHIAEQATVRWKQQ